MLRILSLLVPFGQLVCHVTVNSARQGRIQDLKKEGAQKVRGRDFRHILANLGDFLRNLVQNGVGVHPLCPPLDPRLHAEL